MQSRYPNYGRGVPLIRKPVPGTHTSQSWVQVGGVYRNSFGRTKRTRGVAQSYVVPNNFQVVLKRVRGRALPARCYASSYALFG